MNNKGVIVKLIFFRSLRQTRTNVGEARTVTRLFKTKVYKKGNWTIRMSYEHTSCLIAADTYECSSRSITASWSSASFTAWSDRNTLLARMATSATARKDTKMTGIKTKKLVLRLRSEHNLYWVSISAAVLPNSNQNALKRKYTTTVHIWTKYQLLQTYNL